MTLCVRPVGPETRISRSVDIQVSALTKCKHCKCLFGALVDLSQEGLEHRLLQALALVDGGDLGTDLTNNLLLVLLVELLKSHLVEDGLDLLLLLCVLAAVGSIEHRALLGSGPLDGLVDQPGALVVLDIGTNLTNDGGVTEVVQVVILDLEVLTQRNQNVVSLLEVLWRSDLQVEHGKSNGEVEAVIGGLVGDDKHVLLHGEVVEIDVVLGGGDQITKLTQLGLPGGLVEELNEVNVGGVGTEALLEDEVDSRLQHESIVDRNQADLLLAVPARLTTTGDRAVHDIIAYQEESLEKLSKPAQNAQILELLFGQGLLQEGDTGIGAGKTAVQLAAGDIDVEVLCARVSSAVLSCH